VLRTVSLILTKLESSTETQIIFQRRRFEDVLRACLSRDEFVRQQALHMVSELGVNQENSLKQNVLNAGAIPAIVKVIHLALAWKLHHHLYRILTPSMNFLWLFAELQQRGYVCALQHDARAELLLQGAV
jgi:hypothetical protein